MKKVKDTKVKKAKTEVDGYLKEHPNVELATIVPGEGERHYVFKPVKLGRLQAQGRMADVPEEFQSKMKTRADTIYRDFLMRPDLKLAKPDLLNEPPHKVYERMRSYYRSKDVFGSYIDVLCDLAISGFENDCEDMKIKEFYDNWCEDVDMEQILEWIFQEFWRSGMVRTYKVLGKYEPQTNTLRDMPSPPQPDLPQKAQGEADEDYIANIALWESGSVLTRRTDETKAEYAERKKRWSKGYVPIAYTVLNPTEIELIGPPMFNETRVILHINEEIQDLVKRSGIKGKITPAEQQILDNLPAEIKAAIQKGENIELDPDFVGAVDNRRMPYEKYSINPMVRALEAVEYKESMREADYSTLDGITSEVLVVTVGDREFPVTDDVELQLVADLFNTVQKAYTVVWNHTLKVTRVPVENIDQIFGTKKFEQAEIDISGSMRVPRAMLDGVMIGSTSKDALSLGLKSLSALITYARRQVQRWVRREYSLVAEAYGFDRYPSIRWDTFILKDELAIKTMLMGMVDRRIISYESALKLLGFDPGYEKKMLTAEKDHVVNGDYGVLGSPYQHSAGDGGGGGGIQPKQKTPKKTPSEGRPKGQPAPKTPAPATPDGKTKHIIKKETKTTKTETIHKVAAQLMEQLGDLELDDIQNMELALRILKREKQNEIITNLNYSEEDSQPEEEVEDDQEI